MPWKEEVRQKMYVLGNSLPFDINIKAWNKNSNIYHSWLDKIYRLATAWFSRTSWRNYPPQHGTFPELARPCSFWGVATLMR